MKKQVFIALIAGTVSLLADDTFMGAKIGESVAVSAPQMRLSLRQATLKTVTSSNITVTSASMGQFTIPRTQAAVIVNPKALPATAATAPAAAIVAKASGPKMNPQAQMAAIGQQILGKFSNDPGYTKAQEMYSRTMNGVLAGQISVHDLIAQAETVLKQVAEYGPEREKNPEFEPYIAPLKSFVEQAKTDKKIEF